MNQLSNTFEQFVLRRQRLAELIDEARSLLDEARQLVVATSAEQMEAALSEAEMLLRLGHRSECRDVGSVGIRASLVIVGQTKAGKSSFINEILGEQALAQSQNPCTNQVKRITYAAQPFDLPAEDIAVIGRPSQFLLSSGLDLVDTPGLNENERLDELTISAVDAHLPLVVYVINANNGVNRMVEDDIRRLQTKVGGPDKLFYVATHMDVDEADIVGEGDRTKAKLEREKLQRLLTGLQRLRCFGPESQVHGVAKESQEVINGGRLLSQNGVQPTLNCWPPPPNGFCCVSSRIVATVRRRHRRQQLRLKQPTIGSDDEARWLEAFQLAKSLLTRFAERRLKKLPSEVANEMRRNLLDCLRKDLTEAAHLASEEACQKRRLALLDAQLAIGRLKADAESAVSAPDVARDLTRWLIATLKHRFDELKASASVEAADSASSSEFLNCFTDQLSCELDAAAPRLADCLQRSVSLAKQFEKATGGGGSGGGSELNLTSAAADGFHVAERCLRRQLAELLPQLDDGRQQQSGLFSRVRLRLQRSKLHLGVGNWRSLSAEEFCGALKLRKLADEILREMSSWFDDLHRHFLAALPAAKEMLQSDLRAAASRLRVSQTVLPKCLKLSLHLDSIATDCSELRRCEWQLVAEGAQGSKLYRCAHLAVKEMVLSDRQLGTIAPGLLISRETNEDLVQITGLQLDKLPMAVASSMLTWRLQLCMPFLTDSHNLLAFLALQPSLTDRLRVGLATAEALARLHEDFRLTHGNLHPSNVFVIGFSDAAAAQVKLSDLGQFLLYQEVTNSSKSPKPKLFSQLASEDVCSLGRILTTLITWTEDEVTASTPAAPEVSSDLSSLLLELQPDLLAPAGFAESSCGLSAGRVADRLRALLNDSLSDQKGL